MPADRPAVSEDLAVVDDPLFRRHSNFRVGSPEAIDVARRRGRLSGQSSNPVLARVKAPLQTDMMCAVFALVRLIQATAALSLPNSPPPGMTIRSACARVGEGVFGGQLHRVAGAGDGDRIAWWRPR